MIRNKIKSIIRKAAVRALNMEFDVQDRPNPSPRGTGDFDPSVIPTVVDGAGDTPGPNHKQDIGRTWLAAQVSAGVSPILIDTRPPNETVAGILPGAQIMSGTSIFKLLDQLPTDKGLRVTIYDQTGEQNAEHIARDLREKGWYMARRLSGGFAEWLEYDEEIVIPYLENSNVQVGDSINTPDHKGVIMRIVDDKVQLWQEPGTLSGLISINEIGL